ncbi:UNVERIFIED_CONTAM: hypothetical protein HDU68_006610 [Siphonaria sp. JEL0065]|nr:hypothetical protein HDU68_006610 [Siphonaria sp. JEL0065]
MPPKPSTVVSSVIGGIAAIGAAAGLFMYTRKNLTASTLDVTVSDDAALMLQAAQNPLYQGHMNTVHENPLYERRHEKANEFCQMTTLFPNPHTQALDDALAHLKNLESSTDFQLSLQTERTTIYSKPAPTDKPTNMPIIKGVARITTKEAITLDEIIQSLRNETGRKQWDSRFEGMRLVQVYKEDKSEVLIHSMQHGQWPVVSGRDFCIAFQSLKQETMRADASIGEKGYVVFTSVIDEKVPETKGRVRAHLYCVGWVIEKGEGENDWTVSYYSHLDPVGLPTSVLSLLVNETPACAGKFAAHVEKFGVAEGW